MLNFSEESDNDSIVPPSISDTSTDDILKNLNYESEEFSPTDSEYVPDSSENSETSFIDDEKSPAVNRTAYRRACIKTKTTDCLSHLEITNNRNVEKDNESIETDVVEPLKELNTCSSLKRKWKKVIRIPDQCYFCESEVLNFARHIQRNHSTEIEVQKILSFQTNHPTRKQLISNLRKRGNYLKNVDSCTKPVKKTHIPGKENSECVPCKHCFGYYRPKQLWRHIKTCTLNTEGKTKFSHLSDAQDLLVKHLPIDKQLREAVFPRMSADKISLIAKKDLLICKFGSRYLRNHREKHLINVCSRKMRELAKLLMEVQKLNPSIKNLYDALQPVYFDLFVEATKIVAKFDPNTEVFGSPTYAMNIQTSLKNCCDIAILFTLKRKYINSTISTAESESNFKTFKQLLEDTWKFEISTIAASDLSIKKWNKLTILPLATDVKAFRTYLLQKGNEAVEMLKANEYNISGYKLLIETTFCRLLLLNRKRVGELQRMSLHLYKNSSTYQSYEEFNDAITPTEKILLSKFKRVVIRGKRGRGVPVLFSIDLQDHVKMLIELRNNFVNNTNTYLFPKLNTNNSITGYQIMKKHTRLSKLKNPEALTSTRLRKHLATLTQIFNMNSNDIEQLATFMGHTSNTHKQVYRLPDDIYQTAKISKILMLMEKGKAGKFKGKALDEIEINMDDEVIEECAESDSGDEINSEDELNQDVPAPVPNEPTPTLTIKKRTLIPWTNNQKELTKLFFKAHINSKTPPKKGECEELKLKYPEEFRNKSWPQIKVFVQNIYRNKN